MIITNRSSNEWGEVFGDSVVAVAILDRLLYYIQVLIIRGDSYRLKAMRKAELIKPARTEGQWQIGRGQ